MNRKNLMKKIFIFLLIGFVSSAIAYDVQLFRDIDFFADKYQKNYVDFNLFDFSGNPALVKLAYKENLNIYHFSGGKKINSYHRYFDNERTENRGLDLLWNRNLNESSLLVAGVKYYHSYQMNVERSLEKDFYNHYFSFSDTTNGDITYQGPKLFLSFNQNLTENLLWGLNINYGVERGLKDIFTECETIMRDMDVTLGLGYTTDDKNTIAGLSARYFNRQSQYNSVKYYVSALNRTWIGFHTYFPESPGTTVRKNDDREGYELSLQLEQKHLFDSNFGLRLAGNFGEHKNDIEAGYYSKTENRGYWQRLAIQYLGNLYYNSENFNAQIYYIYNFLDDWAKPKTYEVVAIDNQVTINRIGLIFDYNLTNRFSVLGGFELSTRDQIYTEHTTNFRNNDNPESSNFMMLGGKLNLNQVSSISLRGNYGITEPDFHWADTEQFEVMGVKLGISRQFVFGRVDLDMNYSVISPDNSDKQNEQFGIDLYIQR